jgi:Xaa-Pro dipeptidase
VTTSTAPMVRPDADEAGERSLRDERRGRLLDAMALHGLDALVLGRPADVLFATGARQLWTAGARPFGPLAVVVRATGRAHVLSVFDDGLPPEVPHDDLYGLTWNPAVLTASLRAIPGLTDAEAVGTGSLTPGFGRLLSAVAPGAELVDGGPAIWSARSAKSTAEVEHLRAATGVAEAGLAAMVDALRPGVTERQLLAVHLERLASLGAPTPPSEGVACATPMTGPVRLRRLVTDRPVVAGELVVLDAGALVAGYEGGIGRTWPVGPTTAAQRDLATRCRSGLDALIDRCRPGTSGRDLRAAWAATGEATRAEPIVHGVGVGVEPPIIGAGVGDDAVLAAGMALSVTSWVAAEGVGGFAEREVVLVRDGEPEVLGTYGRGPAGEGP